MSVQPTRPTSVGPGSASAATASDEDEGFDVLSHHLRAARHRQRDPESTDQVAPWNSAV
ncbi:hypothetical protein Q3W71_00275 [Micromonospora sp. C28SCA-DRY-2]|uniref:hypothetical protein n=1 Tax=Micromonospora sp. C28SCA-DRY-2 TaxID=3059522 RepID=UPI0026766F28|nr:hypothetical protein [Micromonospora sp. C28SCA-DRY-2]MDO3700114.1 hypothetical protein [Micromonospora sp. C28SCA-DRY-2]